MTDSILHWNLVALNALKVDFSLPDPRPPELMPQQNGPTYAARALAIVHLAMYDAYMGVREPSKTYLPYTAPGAGTSDVQAAQAAVAAAACITLISLFSRHRDSFLKSHNDFVAALTDNDPTIAQGLAWGHRVGRAMLEAR